MAIEQIEVQTVEEVRQIDHRKEINNMVDNKIAKQNDNMDIISSQLNNISSTIDNIQTNDIDLTEVTDKIDELNTTMITTQNQDILETLSEQQTQINGIEEKLNTILSKLNEM